MRKLVWLLAILLTLGIIVHYLNDQVAIAHCLEQGGSFNYQTDFCSFRESYQGSKGFIENHLAFFLMWLVAFIAAIASLIIGQVGTNPEISKPSKNTKKRLLMIDNYDSFTYNLVQYFGEIGLEMEQESNSKAGLELIIKRNDEITIKQIETLNPDYIVISPGPCTPDKSGVCLEVITHFANKKPILGVCLGHQAMAQVYGGDVVRAEQVMHGKTSNIYHNGQGVFKNLPSPFKATRYHSLIVKANTLPKEFEITAWTQDTNGDLEYIMGIRHKNLPMEGVQFHPESILSEYGHQILRNFLRG